MSEKGEMKMINKLPKVENMEKIWKLKDVFLDVQRNNIDRERNQQEHENKKFSNYKEIALESLDIFNNMGKEDPQIIETFANENQTICNTIKELAMNDKLSEDKADENLSKINESQKATRDGYNDRKKRNNITINAVARIGGGTVVVIALSNQTIKIYKEIKNMSTLSYKFSNEVKNLLKIIK